MSKQLYLTDSGFFLITNKVLDASSQDRYNQMNYAEFLENSKNDLAVDGKLTIRLNSEIPPLNFPLKRKKFKNNLIQIETKTISRKYIAPFDISSINDNEIPEIIKQYGYTLDKEIRDIYVDFAEDGKVSYFNKKGKLISKDDYFLSKGAFIEPQALYIKFNIPRFILKKDDYVQYLKIQKNLHNIQNKRENITSKEYSIINFMKEIKTKSQEILLALIHEGKHLKDEIQINSRQLSINAKSYLWRTLIDLKLRKNDLLHFLKLSRQLTDI